ncbi:hypothetical protein FIC_00661 [Flavobacteriaceae bacterium 3519-10]|nr:hypothetical protein FIC_00661 [Flavobacteriaceae bacterium 3519-10]
MTDPTKYYLFYDGDCGFCNHWVQWILQNDSKQQFMFASLQSEFGQNFLDERNLDKNQFSTVYLWKPGSFYHTKSRAAFEIAKVLGGKFTLLSYLRVLPSSITDFFYEIVAKHRQKLATQKCFLPSPQERKRFIEK